MVTTPNLLKNQKVWAIFTRIVLTDPGDNPWDASIIHYCRENSDDIAFHKTIIRNSIAEQMEIYVRTNDITHDIRNLRQMVEESLRFDFMSRYRISETVLNEVKSEFCELKPSKLTFVQHAYTQRNTSKYYFFAFKTIVLYSTQKVCSF